MLKSVRSQNKPPTVLTTKLETDVVGHNYNQADIKNEGKLTNNQLSLQQVVLAQCQLDGSYREKSGNSKQKVNGPYECDLKSPESIVRQSISPRDNIVVVFEPQQVGTCVQTQSQVFSKRVRVMLLIFSLLCLFITALGLSLFMLIETGSRQASQG